MSAPFINAVEPLRTANHVCGKKLFKWTLVSNQCATVEATKGMTILVDLPIAAVGSLPSRQTAR